MTVRKASQKNKWSLRRGITALETLVAFTLLSTALAVATPLVIRNARLLTEQEDYRLALDEIGNQLERLSALPEDKVESAIADLAPSSFAAARLQNVRLIGKSQAEDSGRRLTLSLSWGAPGAQPKPLSLTTWLYPRPGSAPKSEEDDL